MAGIGVKLNKIFEKDTLTAHLVGFGYSAGVTIAPMFFVIAAVLVMGKLLGLSYLGYVDRELLSCTLLYIFIFSLIVTAPFNAVLSRYMSDVIYEERYDDILPCFYVGLILNIAVACLIGIPFCVHEAVAGQVGVLYVFTGFCGFIASVLTFYAMLFLSICKDYAKISLFFLIGMAAAILLSLLLAKVIGLEVTRSILVSVAAGFAVIACEEIAMIRRYFKNSSGRYRPVLRHFKKYWTLVVANGLYILGLYIHNFVFWTTDLKMVVADSFVCAPSYDMASCLAMLTNISMTVILITRIEMNFHEKYKGYSEAVIGGRGIDITSAQNRMFRQLSSELMSLARLQFIISVVVFLAFSILLPQIGFSGMVMQIYPCLAAGYFILFLMYGAIIFLYYYNDLAGAVLTSASFAAGTLIFSILATHLSEKWYGLGVVAGSLLGWVVSYFRLRWVERNMEVHVFCNGSILKRGSGDEAQAKVYDAWEKETAENEQ